MGIMVYSLLWGMQDFVHQPYLQYFDGLSTRTLPEPYISEPSLEPAPKPCLKTDRPNSPNQECHCRYHSKLSRLRPRAWCYGLRLHDFHSTFRKSPNSNLPPQTRLVMSPQHILRLRLLQPKYPKPRTQRLQNPETPRLKPRAIYRAFWQKHRIL